MDCPHCRVPLSMTERHGIEIDYCPKCRGVWLDRGELDKIIERAASEYGPAQSAPPPPPPPARWSTPHEDDRWAHSGHRRKKKGFLGEMFDFD